MAYKHLIFELTDGIATITFNRPKSLNALNSELLNELLNALDDIDQNENIRVLVLTGVGERAFVAGADISELATLTPLQLKLFSKKGQKNIGRLQELSIPVIAAVNGFALGGGFEIALAADFVYASDKANFGLPEINLGLIPGFGGTQRLPRLIGTNLAKELIFTGRMVPAAEALTMGIANKVCSAETLMEEVMKTAKLIASKGRVALRGAKYSINSGVHTDLSTGCDIENDAFALCMASGDAKEGTTAFIEKRKAEFKGSFME